LREWFNSICHCNGYNNLYNPQLTCLNSTTGSITSIVRHEGDKSAQQLIELVEAKISNNIANLSHHGWILFLRLSNGTVNNTKAPISDTSDAPVFVIIGTTIGAICVLIALTLCIAVVAYGMHKRYGFTEIALAIIIM